MVESIEVAPRRRLQEPLMRIAPAPHQVLHGNAVRGARLLMQQAQAAGHLLGGQAVDQLAIEHHRPGVGAQQPAQGMQVADAAQPKRVKAGNCTSLAKSVGKKNVWRTFFRGAKDGPFDQVWWYTAAPCFRTQADCTAWLYWAQSDWPKYTSPSPCRKGR